MATVARPAGLARTAALGRAIARRRWAVALLQAVLVVALFALWEYASGRWIEEWVISKPSVVFQTLVQLVQTGELWRHARATLLELAIGYAMGASSGLILGYWLGRSQFMGRVLYPIVSALYGIPRSALAPLFIIWLGIGIWSKVGVVFLYAFFLVLFNTYAGLLYMDREYINLARLMGASERVITTKVVLPAIFPYIFTGLKTAVPQSVVGAVVGEFIASTEGLGYMIRRAAGLFDPAGVWVGVLVLLVAVLVANAVLERMEQYLMRWKPTQAAEGLHAEL